MYKADSKIAEEFIDHQEILDTLEYAHNNKSNRAPVRPDSIDHRPCHLVTGRTGKRNIGRS